MSVVETKTSSANRKRFIRFAIVLEVLFAVAIVAHLAMTGNTGWAIGIVAAGVIGTWGYNLLKQ